MRIQYMSDLHLEFAENSRYIKHNEFPVTGDILVLAGDTFYLNNKMAPLGKFWKWASTHYQQVILVPGNHEYYSGCDVMERAFATELGNFIADSRIDTWIYGHSHTNIDTAVGKTRVITNQLGYVFQSEHLLNGLDPGKYIDID